MVVRVNFIDEDRHNVTHEEVEQFNEMHTNEIDGVPVGFCFNLDETGQNQYLDAGSLYLIVPKDQKVPASRATKRITLLHCISTDGSNCDPMIIVPRLTMKYLMKLHLIQFSFAHSLFSDWFIQKFISYLCM